MVNPSGNCEIKENETKTEHFKFQEIKNVFESKGKNEENKIEKKNEIKKRWNQKNGIWKTEQTQVSTEIENNSKTLLNEQENKIKLSKQMKIKRHSID